MTAEQIKSRLRRQGQALARWTRADFDRQLRALMAAGAGEADLDAIAVRASLHRFIDELPLTADDLRFILVLVTMAWGTPPGAAYRQLCSDAAAAGSSPACPIPPAGNPA